MRKPIVYLLLKVIHGLTNNDTLKHEWIENTNNKSLRLQGDVYVPLVNSTLKELNSLRYSDVVILKSLLVSQKNMKSFLGLKASIKKWKPFKVKAEFVKHMNEL